MKDYKLHTVVKSNILIKSSMRFSLNEYKLINYVIGKITKYDKELPLVEISIDELNRNCFNVDQGQSSYTFSKKYAKALIRKHFTLLSNEENIAFFSKTRPDSGKITFKINPDIKEFLIGNKNNFTKYKFINIYPMTSYYSIRLYEFLKSYENKPNGKNITITDLRKMFYIGNKYKKFYDFKKNVLEIAFKEIRQFTDIEFDYAYIKVTRSIDSINFRVKSKVVSDDKKDVNKFDIFFKLWHLYPLKKGVGKFTLNEKLKIEEIGYETIKTCIDRYKQYIEEKKKEDFHQNLQSGYNFFTNGYKDYLDENYTPYKANLQKKNSDKPIQEKNFEQREYDDEFFEGLYENFKE